MKNGYHDHFCETCNHGFICPKVTHCWDDWKRDCPNCRYEAQADKRLDDDAAYEPDDPKHPKFWRR